MKSLLSIWDVKLSKGTHKKKKKRKNFRPFIMFSSCSDQCEFDQFLKNAITQKTRLFFFTYVSRGCIFSALNTVYCYDKKCRPASCSCRRRGNGNARNESTYRELRGRLSNVSDRKQLGRGFCHFLAFLGDGGGAGRLN